MKNGHSTFLGSAVLITAVVGVIGLGVWFCGAFLKRMLSSPHTFSGITITPFGYEAENLATHSYDSLRIQKNNTIIRIIKPKLDISIFSGPTMVSVNVDTVDAYLPLDPSDSVIVKNDTIEIPTFPDNVKFYVPVSIKVDQVSIATSGENSWTASNIYLKSRGEQAASIEIEKIQGDHIVRTASATFFADFEKEKIITNATIKTSEESLQFRAEAPKNNLGKLKANASASIEHPTDWIPAKIPEDLPKVGALKVKGSANIDLIKQDINYKASVETNVGALWPLEPQKITLNIEGGKKDFLADITMKNNEGGTIHLNGKFDTQLDGDFTLEVQNTNALFGPQMMPMDLQIHAAEKRGNTLHAFIETRQGSLIDANLNFNDSLLITFVADISPYEPWALDWTRGNLTLQKPTKMYGTFDMHKLKILSKFDTIPNVYHITADSMQVLLSLDRKGIEFTNGIIYTPKETFDFFGDVYWGTETPHTSWTVTQRHGGSASAYIGIGDTIFIDVKADHAIAETVPFSDIFLSDQIKGNVTGKWYQDFDNNIGQAKFAVEGSLDAFDLHADAETRQNGDTIFIDKANITHDKNFVQANGAFILPNDSNPDFKPTSFLPIQVLNGFIASKNFSIPLLLEALKDSTIHSGLVSGKLEYEQDAGVNGELNFSDIEFKNISKNLIKVNTLKLFAANDKAELNAYLDIGNGGWTGNTQIIIDKIFSDKHHLSFSHGSNNGGTLWADGYIDNKLMFQGTVDANGSWYIPATLSEVKNTDLHIDINADIRKGLKGITAEIRSDSTQYQPPKLDMQLPVHLYGSVSDGMLTITEAGIENRKGESIIGSLQFNLDSLKLISIDMHSDQFSLDYGNHKLVLNEITSHMEDGENELMLSAEIPKISYQFDDQAKGLTEALAHGNLTFIIPHSHQGYIVNNTISGNILIDKLTYYKDISIEVSPTSMDKYLTAFNNYVAKLRSKENQEEKLSTASPINLMVHISDSQQDSVAIVTPFATFPFTLDVWLLGNTTRPLLRGDVANTNTGFIGVKGVYEFALNSFQVTWNDTKWQHGVVDVTSSQELPYCTETNDNIDETCPINLDIQGTITSPQLIPSSNCGMESTAAIYYNIFLGCIADNYGETTDWNELAGKAIGKMITSTANKTLGGDYIGNIEMKVMLFENTSMNDKDSSFVKVPISLDRWVKNLSLIFGYTQDQSENPTYDQSLQFGINYKLPFFQEDEFSHQNHLLPSLDLNALLISKQYLTNTGTEGNENRVEKNVGINYTYRYWNACLLGLGNCEEIDEQKELREKK